MKEPTPHAADRIHATSCVHAAIVQARPAYYDLAASLELALEWSQRAAREGAQLIVLGETWPTRLPPPGWIIATARPIGSRGDQGSLRPPRRE